MRYARLFTTFFRLRRLLIISQLYFEHAETYGPLLNLKVAKKKTSKGLVPMVKVLYCPPRK